MQEIVQFFTEASALSPYPKWIYWCSVIAVVVLTQLIKIPIKHFTNKIKIETNRKRINLMFMIIPFIIGIGISFLLTIFKFDLSIESGIMCGATSQVIYRFLAKLFARTKKGETITKDTVVKDFVESKEESQSAQAKFDELVEKYKKQ